MAYTLSFTADASTNIGDADLKAPLGRLPAGQYTFGAAATSGSWSGTLTLEGSIDGGTTWAAVGPDTTLTANGFAVFAAASDGFLYRLTLSGSSGTFTIKVAVGQVLARK